MQGVACLGDAAAAYRGPARMLGRRQTKVGHHLSRIIEAREIAHFGDDGDSRHRGHAAHCLERLNDGRHGPSWDQVFDLRRQAGDPLFGVMHGVDVVLQDNLLGRVIEAKRRQPAAIRGASSPSSRQRPGYVSTGIPAGVDALFPVPWLV